MKKVFLECVSFCRKTIAATVIVELFQVAVAMVSASVIGEFSDALFNQNASYTISNVGFILLCMSSNVFLVPLVSYWGDVVCIRGAIGYSVQMFSRFINMEYEKAVLFPTGEVKERLESDVIMFRNAVILVLARLVIIPLALTALVFQMSKISIIYMLIACLLSIIVLVTPVITRKRTAVYEDETRQYEANASTILHELFAFAPYAKIFGIWEKIKDDYNTLFHTHLKNTGAKAVTLNEVIHNLTVLTNILASCGILIAGALLRSINRISAGSIITMAGYYTVLLSLFENVGFILSKAKQLKNLAKRLQVFYISEKQNLIMNSPNFFPIHVQNVSYQKESTYILKNINFDISKGQKVALVGKNGTGKSTLLKILTGLYRSYDGSISFGEMMQNDLSSNVLTQCYSYVSQQPFVFSGTVRENIRFGNLDATDIQVEEIMRKLNLFHMRDYIIDAKGNNLSGGELQRISLARAILKERPIMIMDEPSNHLDSDCLAWLKNYIRTSTQTIIFVTHDASFAEMADTIIELKT